MSHDDHGAVLVELYGLDVDPNTGRTLLLLMPTPQTCPDGLDGCVLDVPIGSAEATLLAALMSGVAWDSPPLYQVMGALLTRLDARLTRLHLDPTETRRWRAQMHFALPDGHSFVHPGRASDGLIMAIERGVPITVDAQVLIEAQILPAYEPPEPITPDGECTAVPSTRLAVGSMPLPAVSTESHAAPMLGLHPRDDDADADDDDTDDENRVAGHAEPAMLSSSPGIPLPRCAGPRQHRPGSFRDERDPCTRARHPNLDKWKV